MTGLNTLCYNYTYISTIYITVVVLIFAAASNETPLSLPDNAELQEIIKTMYADSSANLDEITTIKIPNQVSIGSYT